MNARNTLLAGLLLVALLFGGLLTIAPSRSGRVLAFEPAEGEEAPIAQAETEPAEEEIPPALETYMGREIAQTMHYTGAEWLTRDSRQREEDCTMMLENLGVQPGMTVCDMGCGNGFYTLLLAEMVGEEGRVLAVDIQPEMLALLRERAHVTELENIEPVLGSVIDPHLPAGEVDIILCVDVYHEFSHPEHMLRKMREALAPGGRLVLVEFRAEDPEVPIRPLHKMSREQILRELPPNGFVHVEEFEELPWQHMMFFERAEDEASTGDSPEAAPADGATPSGVENVSP